MRKPAVDPAQTLPLPARIDAREVYSRIRSFLAGRLVGATRDEALVEEVVKCIFCRAATVDEGKSVPEDPTALADFYRQQLSRLKTMLPDVFEPASDILLDPSSLRYVDQQLREIDLRDPLTDPIGDAYKEDGQRSLRAPTVDLHGRGAVVRQ